MPTQSLTASARTLLDLPRRREATVLRVAGPRSFRRRVMEMGLVPGVRVAVVAAAPLGDPLTLALRHGRLSIRKDQAAQVLVREEAP